MEVKEIGNEEAYFKSIKKKLIDNVGDKSLLSIEKIARERNHAISYPTLHKLIKGDALPYNLSHIISICDALGCNLLEILDPNPNVGLPKKERELINEETEYLEDENYMGVFYGYMYQPTTTVKNICKFKLEICIEDDIPTAILQFENNIAALGEADERNMSVYTGIPILMKKTHMVYILMHNIFGKYMFFSFRHEPYAFQRMFYRKGALIGVESFHQVPMVENIILLDNEFCEEDFKEYIPGLLKLVNEKLYLPCERLEEMKVDPEISTFFEEYKQYFKEVGEVVSIKGESVLTDTDEWDIDKRKDIERVLMKLASISLNEDRIIYKKSQPETAVVKDLIINKYKEKNEQI